MDNIINILKSNKDWIFSGIGVFIISIIISIVIFILKKNNKKNSKGLNIENNKFDNVNMINAGEKSVIHQNVNTKNNLEEKKIEANEFIWQNTLDLENLFSPIVTFFSILYISKKENEYNSYIKKSDDKLRLNSINYKAILESMQNMERAKLYRPYLSTTLWTLFISYFRFLNRIWLVLDNKIRNNQDISYWYEDDLVIEFLNAFSNVTNPKFIYEGKTLRKINNEMVEIISLEIHKST